MELDDGKSITLELGNSKYVKFLRSFSIRRTIGPQGDILSCPRGEQMVCIPPGALHSDTEIEATFYRVVGCVGLDSSEFVTGVIEITPHQFVFQKPVEILMRHRSFMEDDSSKVTVLFNSGKPTENSFKSLCQLSSLDQTCLANAMTVSLCKDFVCIQTSHLCRFDLLCDGTSYIEIWASLFTPKILDMNSFVVRLFITASRPEPNHEIFVGFPGVDFECRYCGLQTLTCAEKEDLHVTVDIPSDTEGWIPKTNSDLNQTIPYICIRDIVVQGRPCLCTDFFFRKNETAKVDEMNFTPIFVLNGFRCALSPSRFSSHDVSTTYDGNVLNTSLHTTGSGDKFSVADYS